MPKLIERYMIPDVALLNVSPPDRYELGYQFLDMDSVLWALKFAVRTLLARLRV
jgi:hypothetical protein